MMLKQVLMAAAVTALVASTAGAQMINASYDWEDGGSVLGTYTDGAVVSAVNSTEQAHGGNASLKFTEDTLGGTPQAYVAYIEHLQTGDTVTAGMWIYDDTPGASPSGRIWGHYAQSGDVNSYAGSAGGNATYSDGSGWSYLEYTWTFDAGDPPRDALVIEARIYSGADGDSIYVDDINVQVDSGTGIATVTFPGNSGGGYDLSVGDLTHGQQGSFDVSGATPNQMQYLVYSLAGLGSTNVNQLNVTLDLASPVLAAQKRADGNGDAAWSLPIPGNAAGRRVWFQVAEMSNVTDVEDRVVQ